MGPKAMVLLAALAQSLREVVRHAMPSCPISAILDPSRLVAHGFSACLQSLQDVYDKRSNGFVQRLSRDDAAATPYSHSRPAFAIEP